MYFCLQTCKSLRCHCIQNQLQISDYNYNNLIKYSWIFFIYSFPRSESKHDIFFSYSYRQVS